MNEYCFVVLLIVVIIIVLVAWACGRMRPRYDG